MEQSGSLSATNLAVYQHLACDLYLHKVYHTPKGAPHTTSTQPAPTKAVLQKGLNWEVVVHAYLDSQGLLLRIPSMPVDGNTLLENILADERPHFYIYGVTFWPPKEVFDAIFDQHQNPPLKFGFAKPDLLEIKIIDKKIIWRVIDVKSSKNVKASHHIQIYFYTLCLTHILHHTVFLGSDYSAVWLPPHDQTRREPSVEDINAIPNSLLALSFHNIIFRDIPRLLISPSNALDWHYNARCRDCQYQLECAANTKQGGYIGNIPNISANDAKTLKTLLLVSQNEERLKGDKDVSDIEELHTIVADPIRFHRLSESYPTVTKRTRDILMMRKRIKNQRIIFESPLLEAFRTQTVQVIPRYNYTCPSQEDISIIISVVDDKSFSTSNTDFYCITSHSQYDNNALPSPICCSSTDIIQKLSHLIRCIDSINSNATVGRTCQFYVWSQTEHLLLQNLLVHSASNLSANDDDIQTCVYTLASGVSVIHAGHHPEILQATLINFVKNSTDTECKVLLERLGHSTNGVRAAHHQSIEEEVQALQSVHRGIGQMSTSCQLGRLPPVVVLKPEIERQLALPVAGFWDIDEYAATLLTGGQICPSDDDIHTAHSSGELPLLTDLLVQRNNIVHLILQDFRSRTISGSGESYLVNRGRLLVHRNMVLCKEPHIRQLFHMQQFEVFTRLSALWRSRADGCPESPILKLRQINTGTHNREHTFDIIRGDVQRLIPPTEPSHTFFNYLLVKISTDVSDEIETLPLEAFFNDIPLSNTIFPLEESVLHHWEQQDDRVKNAIVIADVRYVNSDQDLNGNNNTTVVIRTWGNDTLLQPGSTFRLSPRFVDFNTPKILASLFETDIEWDAARKNHENGVNLCHCNIPFLQLIIEPMSMHSTPTSTSDAYMELENSIQELFIDLNKSGNKDAMQLILKPSQRTAARSILRNRLSVIWGPPGTGKTHTILLSLLRLLEVETRGQRPSRTVILITAFTHAAIGICHDKLIDLISKYQAASPTYYEWLKDLTIQHIAQAGSYYNSDQNGIQIFIGTIYQLSKFIKRRAIKVDCVIIDEAGQLPLSSASMVLQNLKTRGRVIIAGDTEQLAPIFAARYPSVDSNPIFSSILDCLVSQFQKMTDAEQLVTQLTENFRLNPELCDFLSTIYSMPFNPQSDQTASSLQALDDLSDIERPRNIRADIFLSTTQFMIALSMAMNNRPQSKLIPPVVPTGIQTSHGDMDKRSVSITLIRLKVTSPNVSSITLDSRLEIEATVASSLVCLLRHCSPTARIFVATPHRIQRKRVKSMLSRFGLSDKDHTLDSAMKSLKITGGATSPRIRVDTIERLQGSEADYVICLFATVYPNAPDGFLLDRRRLNVAVSRARTLCIMVTSDEVLQPPIDITAKDSITKGYTFIRAYEERAWSFPMYVPVDNAQDS